MINALKISNLSFAYPGQDPVIENINFAIKSGEKVGLVGPNGAGKTTLFLLITGIIKSSSGQILILEQPIKPGVFHPDVGMIFQHTADQLISPSVREDIAFGPQNMGLNKDKIQERIVETAELTGITTLLDRPPHHLSAGEQRLVALAGILAMRPRLLIMDEPTSDLDIRYRRRLIQLLGNMSDKTMLVASHDLEFIIETCGRVLLLEGGRIQADGDPGEVLSNEKLMENHGLEVPHSLSAIWHRHKK
ncbi:MAG: energy-coupling factor ABC transporter ATP-binding protein [Bacillota bacterium]